MASNRMTSKDKDVGFRRILDALVKRMDEINNEVRSIGTAVKGDPSLGQLGIIPRLDAVEKRMDAADTMRSERAKLDSFNTGRHAVISAAISVLTAGLISILSAFLAAKLSESPAPAYYVLSTGGQAPTITAGQVPAGAVPITPQPGPRR